VASVREFYQLTKPGILRANLLTAAAGYFFGAQGTVELTVLFGLCLGVVGVIGAGCVFNNVVDSAIDARMERTKKRALVTGVITKPQALFFGSILAALGFFVLYVFTNLLTVVLGAVALCMYVVVYGYAKRKSVHGTLVGTLPGAAAIIAGYAAATGTLDNPGLLLTLCMIFWQMPHFYAIAIFRLQEYRAANIPVLPAVKGIAATRVQIVVYCIFFVCSVSTLSLLGYTKWFFGVVMGLSSAYWVYATVVGYSEKNSTAWARKVFDVSLLVLLIFCIMLTIDAFIP
jgi:heme o synthase